MAVAEMELGPEELLTTEEAGQLTVIWRRFRKHKLAVISLVFIVFLLAVALLAPWLMPYPYEEIDVPNAFGSPSAERDPLSRTDRSPWTVTPSAGPRSPSRHGGFATSWRPTASPPVTGLVNSGNSKRGAGSLPACWRPPMSIRTITSDVGTQPSFLRPSSNGCRNPLGVTTGPKRRQHSPDPDLRRQPDGRCALRGPGAHPAHPREGTRSRGARPRKRGAADR